MPKIGGEKPADIAVISDEMKRSVKALFPAASCDWYDFLVSVKAMRIREEGNYKGTAVVMVYGIDRMEKYREKFVKKHEHGLNDAFVFEKYAKYGDDSFMPIHFWEKVRDMK